MPTAEMVRTSADTGRALPIEDWFSFIGVIDEQTATADELDLWLSPRPADADNHGRSVDGATFRR